jgi:hypothetical protein
MLENKDLRAIRGSKEKHADESGENDTMSTFRLFTLHQIKTKKLVIKA